MDVTVITPSLPERAALLADSIASVARQTHRPRQHLIGIDHSRIGAAAMRNELLQAVGTPLVAFLDDDDVLYPRHLDVLCSKLADDALLDVAWSWCESENGPAIPRPVYFNAAAMRRANFIPVTVVARTQAVLDVYGFDPDVEHEDWDLWLRMLDKGARFDVVAEVTWKYRFR